MEIESYLRDMGLTEYESRVMMAVIGNEGLSAKSISEFSGVPYSRIYGTLDSLVSKGWISRGEGRPSTYFPKDLDEILERHLREKKRQADDLRRYIEAIRSEKISVMSPSFSIGYGWESFFDKLSESYGQASSINCVLGFHNANIKDAMEMMEGRFVQGVFFVKESVFERAQEALRGVTGKNVRILSFTPPLWLFFIDRKDILIAIPLDPGDAENSDVKYLELNNFVMGDMLNEIMGVAFRDSKGPDEV